MVVFMIAGHTCSPSLSSMASSSSDSSSLSSSSKSSFSSSSADSFDKERKTETQVILCAQCHLHGGFPPAKVVWGGWHAQRGIAASKGDTIMNEWFLLSSLWSANTADSYRPIPPQTNFRKCPSCQRTRGRCICGLLSVAVLPTKQKH